jgi:hypothetical protein
VSAPLVVNTKDGTCWTRRGSFRGGEALYAPEGVCRCPEFLMATEAELAALGIAGTADVLPVPAASQPSELKQVAAEIARFGIYGAAVPATKALVKRADELVTENASLRARIAELEALKPAPIQTCRVCGAGYDYGQPCSTCAFRARMAAEVDVSSQVEKLRSILAGQREVVDGEHYATVHHRYAKGRDLPPTGGVQ